MRLLAKLIALRDAASAVIEELREDEEQGEEPEILLTRSQKNRRSDKNEVMTMRPLNGAPAVPESWKGNDRGRRSDASNKNRALLAKILADYEPMTRREVWRITREMDPRLQASSPQNNFQQMVNRMVKIGHLRLKHGKLMMGKG